MVNASERDKHFERLIMSQDPLPTTLDTRTQVPMTGIDPATLDPRTTRTITVKVRGKAVYTGPVERQVGAMLRELSIKHGRKLVITCRMRDGRTIRFRGNGSRLLDRV